jgi:hypothetical protein
MCGLFGAPSGPIGENCPHIGGYAWPAALWHLSLRIDFADEGSEVAARPKWGERSSFRWCNREGGRSWDIEPEAPSPPQSYKPKERDHAGDRYEHKYRHAPKPGGTGIALQRSHDGSVGNFGSQGHFSRKRQKSERPGADGRNYSRSKSHLRAAAAMIGIKSPGLDGGCTGVRAKTGTCSWGRAVPPYYLGGAHCLTRLSSIRAARLAAPFFDRKGSDMIRTDSLECRGLAPS